MIPAPYKTCVIVNPNSSNGRTGRDWPRLEAAIRERVGTFDHRFTTRPGEGADLTREALAGGYEMVVSLGGDGTHNEVVNGFFDGEKQLNPAAVLAVVTSGTGGDLRRTLGFEKGPWAALDCLAGRRTRPMDVGRFTYRTHDGRPAIGHFINILSFGIGGLVDQKVNTTSKALGGRASFFIATVRALLQFRRQTVMLSLDGAPATPMAIHNVAIANGRFFGGGMMVAPGAEPDDGLFDVVSFVNMSTPAFVSLANSIYKGQHLTHPNVQSGRASRVEATSDERVLLDVDGEQLGTLPLTVENLKQRILVKSQE
jgi:YegS/Rv2252/BmrU family lipid kinase